MRSTLVFNLMLLPTLLLAQPRTPVVSAEDVPVRAVDKGGGHWFIDFGKDAFGNVQIMAPAGVMATNTLTVHLGEAVSGKDAVDRKPGGCVRYQRHEIALQAGRPVSPEISWEPPGWMKSGWLQRPEGMPEVMPFRYVEIENAPDSFSTGWVRRVSWSVPFNDAASSFTSSSAELNGVWNLCKYSIKATSFLGLYVDGDRERKPYEADALINQLAHYCVDSRYDTARLTHEYLLAHPTWPTEWRLQSVLLAWNDFLWSGDDTSLRKNYDQLKARAMTGRRTGDGLFTGFASRGNPPGLEDIIDWPAVERDGYDMSMPEKTVVTAFHHHALVLLEKIARHLQKDGDAAEFAALAAATRKAFNGKLWDEARGCYVDGINSATGVPSAHASSHANFFPLALGLVPAERVPRVAAFLKSRGLVCSVYGAQFFFDALYQAGEADFALGLLTSDQKRSWRNMSETAGSTITMEAWDLSLKPNLDWNHAWGAAAANIIPCKLMGIEPLEPGFARFRVRPQTAGLKQAGLKLPTPRGAIILGIQRPSENTWSAQITVPQGTVAEFHLPPFQPGSVKLSPGRLEKLGEENGRTIIKLSAGTHTMTLQPAR
jgi:hypothetical protein